jgi:hypothetical protein
MQRLPIPTFFATAAIVMLALGILVSRLNLLQSLSLTINRNGYLVLNETLCYGAASVFGFFAFLYSIWNVPWNAKAAIWHLGLSILCIGIFIASSAGLAMDNSTQNGPPSKAFFTLFALFLASLPVFLLIQCWYLIDGFRRCLPLLSRNQ